MASNRGIILTILQLGAIQAVDANNLVRPKPGGLPKEEVPKFPIDLAGPVVAGRRLRRGAGGSAGGGTGGGSVGGTGSGAGGGGSAGGGMLTSWFRFIEMS
jgi:uncharacterized membrane protein YgcG